MCNIAGYVGSQNATPILLKMIKAQEGLNGGFYSGLAVHDGKKLDYIKTQGDFDVLLKEYDASRLVGNAGIAHTRTPSGGDSSWAHPFVTERDNDVKLCYVANGAMSYFRTRREEFFHLANNLQETGFDIPCKLDIEDNRYCRLKNGTAVHMSDVMCQLIYKYKSEGIDTLNAMTNAFTNMPSEIVGLAIEKENNDRIYFSRINKPMFVGFDKTGAYLASSPTAFPKSVKGYKLLPALSSGVVYKNGYKVENYSNFSTKVRGFNSKTIKNACNIILNLLETGEFGFSDMTRAFNKSMPINKVLQTDAIIYIALYQLLNDGEIIDVKSQRIVGKQSAPKTFFKKLI